MTPTPHLANPSRNPRVSPKPMLDRTRLPNRKRRRRPYLHQKVEGNNPGKIVYAAAEPEVVEAGAGRKLVRVDRSHRLRRQSPVLQRCPSPLPMLLR